MTYRARTHLAGLHPFLTTSVAADGASYAGGGLLYNVDLPGWLRLTASSGPGYYVRNRRGPDLGHSVEFLSSLELSLAPMRAWRVGLALSHLSNGRLGRTNPGTEMLHATFSVRRW